MIYLDHAATTPLSAGALSAMMPYLTEDYANPAGMYDAARKASRAVEEAREKVAKLLGVKPSSIFFTSGGTESDNIAVLGLCMAAEKKRMNTAKSGTENTRGRFRLITSQIEHQAVLKCFEKLENDGFDVVYLPVDTNGFVNPKTLEESLTEDTLLVSVMTANNEVGTIEPIEELAALAHRYGALFHTDAVQAAGNIALDLTALNVDAASVSAHKLNGPKGIGALYLKPGIAFEATVSGGGQEKGMRSGTLNVPGIVGFGQAAEEALERLENGSEEKLKALRDHLLFGLLEAIPEAVLNGDREKRLPGNINLSLPGADSSSLLLMLDAAGICASGGSVCSSGKPSHVLRAMAKDERLVNGALRLTLGQENTLEEADICLEELKKIAERLRVNGILR